MVLQNFFTLLVLFQICASLDRRHFYDYSGATPLTTQFIHFETSVPYPHWSDRTNQKIDVVNSGVIRLSGLDGTNTLDILVFAVNIPKTIGNDIFYQELLPDANMKSKLSADIGVPNFVARDMFIFTWLDVSFTIDLRYSYEDGTKFTRSRFLQEKSGVFTATVDASVAAVEFSNSGKAGRWVLNLMADPRGVKVTSKTEAITASLDVKQFNNFTGVSVRGKFVFVSLALDNNQLTSANDNNEISIVLTKQNADERYQRLDTNIVSWLTEVHKNAVDVTKAKVDIITYKAGSLVVDYSVTIDNASVCGSTDSTKCLQDIQSKVRAETDNGSITSGDVSGTFNPNAIEIAAYDVCTSTPGTFCDVDAYCVAYRDKLSFGCSCKDGYTGTGYVGKCEKDGGIETSNMLIIILSVVLFVFTICCFVGGWYWFKRKENHQRLRKELRVDEFQNATNKRKISFSERLRKRSTRKIPLPPTINHDATFDLYHRQ
ncbi:uncharacterized protein LOC130621581 isoform X2 [Hydractinia symbiolongicarpus]|uniref:uncharacterized protein LOC130621581 isoform X2 n=1 Tax=Hydractinia symbiolongicarpus TaxID=13093 RepID=UPI00254BAD97|nr:uncharacterized protein LOC130621581 isoform X2 [Hydractinia symbiolongicarpus]